MASKIPGFTCPKCNSEVWDNRENKRNPRAPDWRCTNKQCGETRADGSFMSTGGWFKKPNAPRSVPQGPPPTPPASPTGPITHWADLEAVAARSLDMAFRQARVHVPEAERKGAAWTDFAGGWAGCLFKAARELRLRVADPPRPPAPAAQSFSDFPEALDDENDNDLPF